MIPQYLMIGIVTLNLLLSANLHGKIKTTKYHNFWISFVGCIIQVAILYYGGFFDKL